MGRSEVIATAACPNDIAIDVAVKAPRVSVS